MNQGEVIEKMKRDGKLETVAQVIGDEAAPPPAAFEPARREDYPTPPPPVGLHFGVPDEEYHAWPALSCSGIRKLASSPALYWATTPWLNPDIEDEEEADWKNVGKAYHARILEGKQAFHDRFAIALDKDSIPDLCVTIDDIRARLLDVHRMPTKKTGKKEEFVAELLALEPDAPIWEECQRRHAEANAGKTLLSFEIVKKIEIAAAMIEKHPELSRVFASGYPEVSLVWNCKRTGVLMKARADWLKVKGIVDLKSYENKLQQSPENAIRKGIANNRYNLQPSVYFDGAQAVRELVREQGAKAVFVHGAEGVRKDELAFAEKWAAHRQPDEWLWVFQQKGIAPITRGVTYPRAGVTKQISDEIVSRMKKRYREFSEEYGAEPWLDLAGIYDIADEDIPPWATEI